MRESTIEKYLCDQVKKHGGLCEKFKSPGRKNVPDRIVSWPERTKTGQPWYIRQNATVVFVELKRPKKGPTDAQQRDHDRRRRMGLEVWVINSKEQVDDFISLTQ